MRNRYRIPLSFLLVILVLGSSAGCSSTTPPSPQPTVAPDPPNPTPAVDPTDAVAGEFQPLEQSECEALRQAVAEKLGVEVSLSEGPFQDPFGGSGTGCLLTATGTGVDFPTFLQVATDLRALLEGLGWAEDPLYLADAPVGTAYGMRRETRLGLVSVMWAPSADANCPQDRPIFECQLQPEQMLYTITLQLAQLPRGSGAGDLIAPSPVPTQSPYVVPYISEDLDNAREALLAFFTLLHDGRYGEAVAYYGGDYQVLRDWNPDVPADGYAQLLENGCTVNGLQCLAIRTVDPGTELSAGVYQFSVDFVAADGSVFTRGSESQFPYTVQQENGEFLVQELPVYVP